MKPEIKALADRMLKYYQRRAVASELLGQSHGNPALRSLEKEIADDEETAIRDRHRRFFACTDRDY